MLVLLFAATGTVRAQQMAVSRIDQMPDRPSPYHMRNWKVVALGYDSLIFDLGASGTYLPVTHLVAGTVNYPSHGSFGMPSYVGSLATEGEGVNCLPAVIGASLCGVDKSSQGGRNWALMCEEWFNNRPAENVYLNSSSVSSGDDWWYETMPNVFFYQLASFYPGTGDFHRQVTTVADRWLAALRAMGGGATPWQVPNAGHRAWSLSTMTPNNTGVLEPEAAGAIGWILYQAYVQTGDQRYRIGAEWALEYLQSLSSNPSYELQLSYGTYAAARLNAELGTTYDVPKMVNWCFDIGPLRNWGAMTDPWFGYDCAGLIGEVNGTNNYAFAMNTFEQLGTLIPLVRYDARFARAIGKWALNAANAARLFYCTELPDDQQDSRTWTQAYDPNGVVAHEALRQYKSYSAPFVYTAGPYATGDAIVNGWAPTNLGLYGSSHAGILGAIIDTTDVPMILKLDVLKTDYRHTSAYPSYLFFNPDTVQRTVTVSPGSGQRDIYDAAAHAYVQKNVTGTTGLTIASGAAILAVFVPSGGAETYDIDRYLVNGIVVDYHSGHHLGNIPPRIKALMPDTSVVVGTGIVHVYCTAADANGDSLAFDWHAASGGITGSGSTVSWHAPDTAGVYVVTCVVGDGHGGQATASDTITVVIAIDHPPVIAKILAFPRKVNIGASSAITCIATDPDSDALGYAWSVSAGSLTGSGRSVNWQAPPVEGNCLVRCLVTDGRGGISADSLLLEVRDFSKDQTGSLVAFYPFNGNANDASGNHHDGTAAAATYTADRFAIPAQAMAFNGTTTSVVVPSDPSLNFTNGITVSFWIRVSAFFTREQYPVSHGNWQNRWKVSISNNKVRWTVKTSAGVKDLDSESLLVRDSLYLVTAAYNGSDIEIYLNGQLDAFASFSGPLLTTATALTIGQDLPGDNNYNFDGVLDDLRLYDYALSVNAVSALDDLPTAIGLRNVPALPGAFALEQNFPNPFNPATTIRFSVPGGAARSPVRLDIVDMLGRTIDRLVDGDPGPGVHEVIWDASRRSSGLYYCRMTTPAGTQVRKMILIK